jgi:hypothetical protein
MASNAEITNLVLAAIERCLAMQAEHLAGLKAGCMTKINQWLEERQDMITRLRQVMAHVSPAEVDADVRELLLDRISCILDREKTLYAIAEGQRDGLHDQLTKIRRGQRALHGYGPTMNNHPPHFVSDKG